MDVKKGSKAAGYTAATMSKKDLASGLIAALVLVGAVWTQEKPAAFPPATLRPLEKAVLDLTALGRTADADLMLDTLRGLGYPEKPLSSLMRRREKTKRIERGVGARVIRLQKSLARLTPKLAEQLASIADETTRRRTAKLLLRIDHSLEPARRTLGHSRVLGRWVAKTDLPRAKRRAKIQMQLQRAWMLEVDVTVKASGHEVLRHVHTEDGHAVSGLGVTIHTCWPASKARRIITNVGRAVALSRFLLHDEPIALPSPFKASLVLLNNEADYKLALDFDNAKGQLRSIYDEAKELSAYDRTDGTRVNYSSLENHAFASVFCYVTDVLDNAILDEKPHTTLVAGHANWVLMTMMGAQIPGVAFYQEDNRKQTTTNPVLDDKKFLIGAGLMGARTWLRQRVAERQDPPWSRSFVEDIGKIEGEDLLKTTFVAEYLQLQGPLEKLFIGVGDGINETREERVQSMQKGLGKSLHEFEKEWRAWLLGSSGGGDSILARLDTGSITAEQKLLERLLARVRGRAHTHSYIADVPPVLVDPELSSNALEHARYLQKNKDQRHKWPDALEEFTDREGFSPEGCWAGNHSILISGSTGPTDAMNRWMASFQTRLSILDPGLLQVGWGFAADTAVMDVKSIVRKIDTEWEIAWPPDGMKNVPLRIFEESFDPVPGADRKKIGYPITLQLGPRADGKVPEIEMSLQRGKAEVPCHVSSPQAPKNPLLVPKLAWCLFPEEPLKPNAKYQVTATFKKSGRKLQWSFTTGRK